MRHLAGPVGLHDRVCHLVERDRLARVHLAQHAAKVRHARRDRLAAEGRVLEAYILDALVRDGQLALAAVAAVLADVRAQLLLGDDLRVREHAAQHVRRDDLGLALVRVDRERHAGRGGGHEDGLLVA